MNISYTQYLFFGIVVAFFTWRWVKALRIKKQLPELLSRGAIIVDVRSPDEFAGGHAPGSLNLPLPTLPGSARQLDRSRPIVLCCASGMRSGVAAGLLKKDGFQHVLNGGTWGNVCGKGQ